MKTIIQSLKMPFTVAAMLFVISGCATSDRIPEGSVAVRQKLTQLQSDPDLSTLAPVEIKTAEAAVIEAEKPTSDKSETRHRVFVADRKIDTAAALAQKRLLENQRKLLNEESINARLDSRTREANQARSEADQAKQQAEELQRQIAELNAKATDRGLVVTLGDVLFDTDKSALKESAHINLAKLSAFLTKYPDRTVVIEGHTDSQGSADYNLALSQRRADAVKVFLLEQGIDAARITSFGKGEDYPVASNETASGRQQNRRVEVIISNKTVVNN